MPCTSAALLYLPRHPTVRSCAMQKCSATGSQHHTGTTACLARESALLLTSKCSLLLARSTQPGSTCATCCTGKDTHSCVFCACWLSTVIPDPVSAGAPGCSPSGVPQTQPHTPRTLSLQASGCCCCPQAFSPWMQVGAARRLMRWCSLLGHCPKGCVSASRWRAPLH